MEKPKIGFIGQGFIGKNYADDFEERGYPVVRYGLEPELAANKEKIAECDIVLIAVPTPTTSETMLDTTILKSVIKLVGKGKIAVIKSTILPGEATLIQLDNPEIDVLHSPEFLTEKTAAHDARHPDRNIIGYCETTPGELAAAKVMEVLPHAPFTLICREQEAAMTKIGGNCWFYVKVMLMNTLFDLCKARGIDFDIVKAGMKGDSRIGPTHLEVEHQGGRGAGGHCFIKDFAAFQGFYQAVLGPLAKTPGDDLRFGLGNQFLVAAEKYNATLLQQSGKDVDLLKAVYGDRLDHPKAS